MLYVNERALMISVTEFSVEMKVGRETERERDRKKIIHKTYVFFPSNHLTMTTTTRTIKCVRLHESVAVLSMINKVVG